MKRIGLIAIAGLGLLTAPTHANVVETFDYTTTADLGSAAVTGTGQQGSFGNFWFANNVSGASDASIQSGSLTAPTGYGFTPTNNRLGYDEGGNLDAVAIFEFADGSKIDFASDGVHYLSFLIRAFDNNSTSAELLFQDDTGSTLFAVGETSAGTGQLSVNGALSADKMDTNGTNTSGVDNLVVLKIETSASGSDQLSASFWTSGVDTVTGEPVTWDVTSSIISGLTAAGFRIQIPDGFANLDASLDEIRIGDSFFAVTGVPEPGSLALMGLGGLLLMSRRRAA